MLTSEHAIVNFERDRALPDRLSRKSDAHYVDLAAAMLRVYREGVGLTRRELHRHIERLFDEEPCDARRIASFCKLLDDASTFHTDGGGKAARLRLKVFRLAAKKHPLVTEKQTKTLLGELEQEEAVVKQEIAAELGMSWQEIDEALYADVMQFHRLKTPPDYPDENALLSHYNVAQTQAALYKAQSATLTANKDFKTILRYVKLAGLLHEIRRVDETTYRIQLDGPASLLRTTSRYGVRFATLLPALLTCKDWSFTARIRTPWKTLAILDLSPDSGLKSHLDVPPEFDSIVEENFAGKFGEERDGWRLVREGAILYKHQKTFVPDFVFRHEDGREVFFEIVGFWTPEYLKAKLETLETFSDRKILLAVCENEGALEAFGGWAGRIITYKTGIKLGIVMAALETLSL